MGRIRTVLTLLLLILLATLISGCSDEDPVALPPETGPVIDSPDKVMEAFALSYEDMDLDLYTALLHTDFKMTIIPSTVAEWAGSDHPIPNPYFSRDDEIGIHTRFFTGALGLGPAGETLPPVSSISVEVLEKIAIWADISPTDPDFAGYDGVQCMYFVQMYFNNPDFHRYLINQAMVFYVAPVDVNGQTSWTLLGIRQLSTKSAADESTVFCSLKALYREIDG